MSNNKTVINTIEIVKKKLKKYTALKEHEKVKEYLGKLRHISLNSSLIQETKIDILIRKLASNKTANYSSIARHLLKKWHHKNLLSKSNKIIIENKLNNSNEINESQSSPSSSDDNNKKRKVLSLEQYLENKKHILSSSLTINSTQKKLTNTQIKIINAQFQATTEKLTASTSNLVNKNLIEIDKINTNRNNSNSQQSKFNDLWAEDDDDDDDNAQ